MTLDQLDFSTYCIGALSEHLNMSQPHVYRLLHDSGILSRYIIAGYPVLHTYGEKYIVREIEDLMREKKLI